MPAGARLLASTVLANQPSCSGAVNCPTSPFAWHALQIHQGTTLLSFSENINQNYQFRSRVNDSGSTKTWRISILLKDWKGMTGTTFGLAWVVG